MTDRRSFLKILGASLGSALLTSCTSGGSGGGGGIPTGGNGGLTPLPNAFNFVQLVSTNTPLPGGNKVQAKSAVRTAKLVGLAFNGAVLINDLGQVVFHASNSDGKVGIYRIDTRSGGAIRKIVAEGDALPDGSTVRRFGVGALNNRGTFVTVIQRVDKREGLYIDRGNGLELLLTALTTLPSGVRVTGRFLPHVSIHDNDDILFGAHYADKRRGSRTGQALFFAPRAQASQAQLVLGRGDVLPGTTSTIDTIGAFVLEEGSRFVLHGQAKPAGMAPPAGHPPTFSTMPTTFAARGTVGGSLTLLAAHGAVDVPSAQRGAATFSTASSVMAPRTSGGRHAAIHHTSTRKAELRIDGQLLLIADLDGNGSASPEGHRIVSMLPPVVSRAGLIFYHIVTTRGMELCVTNGEAQATVLSRGDQINNAQVNTIFFGGSPHGANASGQIVAVIEFTDRTAGIYLGNPV